MIPLALALSSKKMLADFDAPSPPAMVWASATDPGDVPLCAKCGGEGVIYHDLPGSWGREPCGCMERL